MKTITEKDLETLQRYGADEFNWGCGMSEDNDGAFVSWESLLELLK